MQYKHNINPDNQPNQNPDRRERQAKMPDDRTDEEGHRKLPHRYRPHAGAAQRHPFDYDSHPYPSMKCFDAPGTAHSYYRQMRLVHEFCQADPELITEARLRDYILYVKTVKHWSPKTIRQVAAAAKLFFIELLEHGEWKIFSQIRTRDEESLPAVPTRGEVIRLLRHIRLSRYRIPVKPPHVVSCPCCAEPMKKLLPPVRVEPKPRASPQETILRMTAARSTATMTTCFFRRDGQGHGGLRLSDRNGRGFPMFCTIRPDSTPGDQDKSPPA